jgi:hypothetical protein
MATSTAMIYSTRWTQQNASRSSTVSSRFPIDVGNDGRFKGSYDTQVVAD